MRLRADAWYSTLSFRQKPIAVVVVAHSREWGRVEQLELPPMHPAPAQFIRSQLGALRKRLERGDIPSRVDLIRLSERFKGDVQLSAPMPISGPPATPWALLAETITKRVVKTCLG